MLFKLTVRLSFFNRRVIVCAMKRDQKIFINALALFIFAVSMAVPVLAQEVAAVEEAHDQILQGAALTRVIPASFYFEGQAAPTQMRNADAARASSHLINAEMVDTCE